MTVYQGYMMCSLQIAIESKREKEEVQVSILNTFTLIQFYWTIFNCKQVCILDSV